MTEINYREYVCSINHNISDSLRHDTLIDILCHVLSKTRGSYKLPDHICYRLFMAPIRDNHEKLCTIGIFSNTFHCRNYQ